MPGFWPTSQHPSHLPATIPQPLFSRQALAPRTKSMMNGDDRDAYDPDQNAADRRRIRRDYRCMQQEMREHPDRFLQADSAPLLELLDKADARFVGVKQPTEAAIDSRILLSAADVVLKRQHKLTAGGNAGGVDVDEFIVKLKSFMLHRKQVEDDADEDEEDGDLMAWAHLGKFACVSAGRRPGLPGFLVGPLAVEKKVRTTKHKKVAFRVHSLHEVRPVQLQADDLNSQTENDLTAQCHRIYRHLRKLHRDALRKLEALPDACRAEAKILAYQKLGLREAGAGQVDGIDLFRFVINPRSFGQTVENMFFVSFLIREAVLQLDFDAHGIPFIVPLDPNSKSAPDGRPAKRDTDRHQAVLAIDMDTWRELIAAFEIDEPMIPHRNE